MSSGVAMDKLQKRLYDIQRMGMVAEVKDGPAGATTFDKMIIVWLERPTKRFLHQVHFWDSKTEKIVGSF